MLIVRRSTFCKFLLGQTYTLAKFEELISRLKSTDQAQNGLLQARDMIVQTCQDHLAITYPKDEQKTMFLGAAAAAALSIRDEQLFQRALSLTKDGFDAHHWRMHGTMLSFEKPAIPISK